MLQVTCIAKISFVKAKLKLHSILKLIVKLLHRQFRTNTDNIVKSLDILKLQSDKQKHRQYGHKIISNTNRTCSLLTRCQSKLQPSSFSCFFILAMFLQINKSPSSTYTQRKMTHTMILHITMFTMHSALSTINRTTSIHQHLNRIRVHDK